MLLRAGRKKESKTFKIVANGAGAAAYRNHQAAADRMAMKNVILTATARVRSMRADEGLNPIKEEMATVTNQNIETGYPGRGDQGRRRIYRRFRTGHSDQGDGTDDGKGCYHLRMREPDSGDFPG